MKALVIIMLAVSFATAGFAQHDIKGKITDLETNKGLQGATITNDNAKTITNEKGEFELSSTENIELITITYVGYESQSIKIKDGVEFLHIQLSPSTVSLNEVIISGYESNRKLLETPGAVALITKSNLSRNNSVSLQPALNNIPGVQMDQSHSEDARISIRGVGIQSTFGIRNLKVYLNDIPLTEANGFTRIEGLDISTLGRVEIIKGPASSIYGAALGGVMLFHTQKAPYNHTSIEQSVTAGSYGLLRLSTTLRSGTDNANIVATYGYQKLDGYRQWSNDQRNFVSATGQFFPNSKQSLSFFLNHSEQDAHIPGALDSLEFATTPAKADSVTLSKKSARYEKWTRAGLSQTYRFNDHLSNITSVNMGFFSLDHPLAFAYIRGTYQSFGGRTLFTYSNQFGKVKTKFIAGAEYLNGLYVNKYYDNIGGKEGAISQDGQTTAIQYSYFAQAEFEFPKKILLTLGASNSGQKYLLKDFLKENGADFTGNKNFAPRLSPRIALLKTFKKNISIYATASTAFMPPVDYEISLPGGGINRDIRAVTGINYEMGTRGEIFKKKLRFDLSLYNLQLNNELIPQTVAPYQMIYVNTGKTNHTGLELSLSYLLINDDEKAISLLQPFLAYSYNDFIYKDHVLNDADYSGKKLPGISPNLVSIGFDAKSKYGLYLNGSFHFHDEFPMTDDNTRFNKSYCLLDSKIGFRKMIKPFEFDVYAGINNALDTHYASYIDLNATSNGIGTLPKFYNPSPLRNYYTGFSIKYIIK